MKSSDGNMFQKVTRLLVAPTVEPGQRAARIQTVEKDIILPIKGLLSVLLISYFFFSDWTDRDGSLRNAALNVGREFLILYIALNLAAGIVFVRVRQLSLRVLQRIVFALGLLDGVLLGILTLLTTGFDSIVYWVFPAVILHNALAIPIATPQIALNLLVSFCYIFGGMADKSFRIADVVTDEIVPFAISDSRHHNGPSHPPHRDSTHPRQNISTNKPWEKPEVWPPRVEVLAAAKNKASDKYAETRMENPAERLIVLLLWAMCCYGIQTLFEKQKRAEAEATEFAVRQERLHTAGRMAAEIAHEIKNPLGIITNAAFSLQRAVQDGRTAVDEQVQIIREEIERADRIITELMGYAQLAEGKVEKLDVLETLDQAIKDVFPPAAKYEVVICKNYEPDLPALMMQRRHFAGVLVNILQNAREAMNGHGKIDVAARSGENDSVVIVIRDNGPGIPSDKIERIFEAYFTTRAKGTGLGLAIVKHNTEIYGGTVRVESELGKGTCFTLNFPARILMRIS